MVNILRFPGSSWADVQAASADEAEIFISEDSLSFSWDDSDKAPEFQRLPSLHRTGDWSNQELADLYRVEALLVQAGMRLNTCRGKTDEDDPWFVFGAPDGDVFVHLARVDGRYVLDSPGLGSPIYGHDFTELVDVFVRHQTARAPSGNVVSFRPGAGKDGVVRLHPAMTLAALIWTLYLASDHFAGTAEAGEFHGHQTEQRADDEASQNSNIAEAPGPAHLDYGRGRSGAFNNDLGAEPRNGSSQPGGQFGNGIAASLSAIAVSWGLFAPHYDALPSLVNADDIVSARDMPAKHVSYESALTSSIVGDDKAGWTENEIVKPQLADEHGAAAPNAYVAVHVLTNAPEMIDSHLPGPISGPHDADPRPFSDFGVEGVAAELVELALSLPVNAEGDAPSGDVRYLLNAASVYGGEIKEYSLGDRSIAATFDIQSLNRSAAEMIFSYLPSGGIVADGSPGLPADTPPSLGEGAIMIGNHVYYMPSETAAYGAKAKDFILNFLLQSSHIEMIKVDNAIIFVDTTAIDDASDVTEVKTWLFDDASTVSTIGHADYFAKYLYLDHALA